MTQQPNLIGYTLAQNFIASGAWTVDLERGIVCGLKGEPFRRTNSWGYTQIKFRRPEDYRVQCAVLAHRVIWESLHGPMPADLEINHRNGQKTDNRISNLEAVTPSANVTHAYATGLNEGNHGSPRLTENQALEIYRRCVAGERDLPLAADYAVSRETINGIRNGWTWSRITGHKSSGPKPPYVRPSRSKAAREKR